MFSIEVIYFSSYAIVLAGSAMTIILARGIEKAKHTENKSPA